MYKGDRATAGSGFALTVAVENVSNSVVTNYTGSVTVTIASNPGGSTLGGSYILLTNNGVATFCGLSLNKSGSGYTLTTALGTLTINKFGSVTANRGNGSSDTVHLAAAIDFVLSDPGWTSV